MQTKSTGQAVERIDTPRPAMMLVPWPVVEACAMCCTGLYCGAGVVLGDPDQRGGQHEADGAGAEQAHAALPAGRRSALSGISQSVTK